MKDCTALQWQPPELGPEHHSHFVWHVLLLQSNSLPLALLANLCDLSRGLENAAFSFTTTMPVHILSTYV